MLRFGLADNLSHPPAWVNEGVSGTKT